jgi:malonyl-CoA decarboxylase
VAKSGERHWRDRLSALGFSRQGVAQAFAKLLRSGAQSQSFGASLAADLPEEDVGRLRKRIDECLEARGGAVSARARAAELGRAYLALDEKGRTRFLTLLAGEYGPDRERLAAAAAAVAGAETEGFAAARRALADALVTPRLKLLRQFNGLEQGAKFLVDLRADLLALKNADPAVAAFEAELYDLLASWFDVGFLTLQRITWEAPAALLEKLVAYEAVHEIRSWDDLKNRLDSDRRCYAYFHPAMPGEPLIFVEVALVAGLSGNVQALLDEHAPAHDPAKADTAIFYSISNAQKGLQGVAFGDFLIKRVVDTLAHDLPNLKVFATLSPIPGFRRWLAQRVKTGVPLLHGEEAQRLSGLAPGAEAEPALLGLLGEAGWPRDEPIAAALQPILMRLCARYLIEEKRAEKRGPPRAVDPVAHFHLSNGARVERINWLADVSKNGLSQSAGLMVNYLYRLGDIETNHERYRSEGRITASSGVKSLL